MSLASSVTLPLSVQAVSLVSLLMELAVSHALQERTKIAGFAMIALLGALSVKTLLSVQRVSQIAHLTFLP